MAQKTASRWTTRKALHERLHGKIAAADFAAEFPIQWIEELTAQGELTDGPGLGEHAVWMNHDNSMGAALEISSFDPYYANAASVNELQRSMAQILMQLEYGETLQWIFFPWDDASELISRFRRIRPDDPPFKKWWINARAERELARLETGDLRCFRSVVALNLAASEEQTVKNPYDLDAGVAELFGSLRGLVQMASILKQNLDGMDRRHYEAKLAEVHQRMLAMQRLLAGRSGQFHARPWSARDLCHYLRRVWNPEQWVQDRIARGRPHTLPRMDARWAPFASYIIPPSTSIEDQGDCFRVGDYWHRILTMNTLPAEAEHGVVPAALTVPPEVRGIRNMVVTMTARPLEKWMEMQKLRVRIRHLSGEMKNSPEHSDNNEIIDDLQQRITQLRKATRPQMYNVHLHVHLYEKDRGLLREHEHRVSSALASYCEMSVGPEDFETLPFVVGFEQPGFPRYDDENRFFSVVPLEVAALTPVSAYSDGCVPTSKDAAVPMLFETDTGVPYGLHIFPGEDRVTNPGTICVGVPGSGKTNVYQQIILGAANRGADVVVIDGAPQPGFGPICELLGGQYVEFNDDFRLAPLATKIVDGVQQVPNSEELTAILITMNAMFRPERPFTPIEMSVFTNCVRFVFENRQGDGSRVRLSDLRRAFDASRFVEPAQKTLVGEFSMILEETWLGRYGHIMSGTEELPHSWLTVFDVRVLSQKGNEQLQAVVVACLFRHIERLSRDNIRREGKDKRELYAIVDEAWKAIRNKTMLPLIIEGYRAGRARALSMHLLSQGMEEMMRILEVDADGSVLGEKESSPILICCSHILLFNLGDTDAPLAAKAFNLNPVQTEALRKLGGEQGQYREFIHILKGSDGHQHFTKLRSRITPQELWATTTSPKSVALRLEMQRKLREDLASGKIQRLDLVRELSAAGWEIDTAGPDAALIQCVAIHRLAKTTL